MTHIAIIGGGATAIFLLKHMLDDAECFSRHIESISIFEDSPVIGMGMPYNPLTTDRYNMSNISSEELPELPATFVDWLRDQDPSLLRELGVLDREFREDEVYPRLALGRYLHDQYLTLVAGLVATGIEVDEFPALKVTDIRSVEKGGDFVIWTADGRSYPFHRVVIATGHHWTGRDRPEQGFYASPWPIHKLLPATGKYHNFTIGTLGASLSAFDVISSLAHRHGKFAVDSGRLVYRPFPGTDKFGICMHSVEGLLPHLQFDQVEPLREIYRHVDRRTLLSLIDGDGFLRLHTYFDQICRPALSAAFAKDGINELVEMLSDPQFDITEFAEKMTDRHDYRDAFEGMRRERVEARKSAELHQPIHWKEVIDDLMYTLNFHAELMPAEDHLALRSVVMPFLMNVVAAMPLNSVDILLALHDAGKLEIVAGKVEINEKDECEGRTTIKVDHEEEKSLIHYPMFVDCSGQQPSELDEFPFQGLVESGAVRRARARFADPGTALASLGHEEKAHVFEDRGGFCFHTGGVDVDAKYRIVDSDGVANPQIFDVAFPHISGVRPYSFGLQACNDTAGILVKAWLEEFRAGTTTRSEDLETMN